MTTQKKTTADLYAERILGERPKPADLRPSWERHAERLRQAAGVEESERPGSDGGFDLDGPSVA